MAQSLKRALAPAAGIAAMVGVWLIGSGKELWYSERFVQVLGQQSWRDMFNLLRFENNPPLFFVIARLWEAFVGHGERALRVLPLLFGIAFLVILWKGTERIAGRRAAQYTVMIAGVSGLVASQATEYRMYTLLLCCSAAAIVLTRMFAETRSSRTLYALTAVNVVGLYTHYTYVPMWLFLCGWLLVTVPQERKRVCVHALASLGLFAPWLWYSLIPILVDLRNNLGIQQHSGAVWELLVLPLRVIVPPLFGEARSFAVARALASVAAATAVVAGIRAWSRGDGQGRRTMRFLIGSTLFAIAVFTAARLTAPKYASVAVPGVVILIGAGLSALDDRSRFGRYLAAVTLVVSVTVAVAMSRAPYVTYAESARIVEQEGRAGDRVLIFPFNDEIALRPYYRGSLRVDGFFPLRSPGSTTLRDNIQYNFRSTLDERTVGMLGSYVTGAPRVWFFYDVSPADAFWRTDLIDAWFSSHGYSRTVYRDSFNNAPPLLVRYDAVR